MDNHGWGCRYPSPVPCMPDSPQAVTAASRVPQPRTLHSLLLVGKVLLPLRLPVGGGEMERTEPVSSSWEQPAWMARR